MKAKPYSETALHSALSGILGHNRTMTDILMCNGAEVDARAAALLARLARVILLLTTLKNET